ncbi:interleukin-6 receptor subunit beta-like [Eucyclogobius newberryi]|uniref:interleukin-6 receptor subunit beta-like n=1 Tax=Eucyclogobius newberryi TaxID=166745 RepID=UPI003B598A5C
MEDHRVPCLDCHITKKYWTEINKTMQTVFNIIIPFNFGIMYLGLKPPAKDTKEDYSWNILLGRGQSDCGVYTTDQHIEQGSDAEITCQSACVSGTVFWTLNDKRVNQSLSRRINSTHTVILLPHSALQDPSHPIAVVQCHSEDNHQILGGTTIGIYTKPHNLSCIFHSNREMKVGLPKLFTCSWEHQIYTPVKIDYSVICVHCATGLKEICSSNVRNCTRNTLDVPQISFVENNTIYVKAKAEAWEAQSSVYTFTASQIFKIPPREVNVTAHLDHILVDWNSLPKQGVNGMCQVKYKYTKNKEIIKDVLNTTLTPDDKGRLTIAEVESCRTYSVCVRCALARAPWSYWSPERPIQTQLQKNDVKLDVWRKVSKLHKEVKVHIMWKGIPSNCPGTLSFSVSHVPHNKFTSRANYTTTSCANSSCDITVKQEAHTVNLTVLYNGDFLAANSFYLTAFVGNESEKLLRVNNIETKHDENGLVVDWTAPSPPVSGYVIDWTHSENDFEWKRTNITHSRLHGLVDKASYNITVTPLFGNKAGPSTQISGVCSSFAEPGNVTIVNLETYDKSAHLSWSVKSEEKCSDAVVNYSVFYGTVNGPELNVTIKNTEQKVSLMNLNPDTQYSVHVVATARSGNSKSIERLFKTKMFDPQLITVFTITGGIVLVLLIGLFRVAQKLNEKPVPDPGLSSLALWPQNTQQKTIFPIEPFITPSESPCERVCTEEMQQTSTTTCHKSPVEQIDRTTKSSENYERPFLSSRTPRQCRDSVSLLTGENSHVNPYRSQGADESPAPHSSKKAKRAAMRMQERIPSYVSLDMFDWDQCNI